MRTSCGQRRSHGFAEAHRLAQGKQNTSVTREIRLAGSDLREVQKIHIQVIVFATDSQSLVAAMYIHEGLYKLP